MIKSAHILAYVQILLVVCLMIGNGGGRVNFIKKSEEFPCKGHHCGCKSETDCKTHCCCALYENHDKFQNNSQEQKNIFRTFISSINCKYGNNPLTDMNFTVKYIMEDKVPPIKGLLLCFLFHNTSIFIPEVIASSIEKPPRLPWRTYSGSNTIA